jgi:hypothetical protein
VAPDLVPSKPAGRGQRIVVRADRRSEGAAIPEFNVKHAAFDSKSDLLDYSAIALISR